MNKINEMSLDFCEKFSELKIIDHLSSNSHYIGYYKANNEKVFIKKFTNHNRFTIELNTIKVYCSNQLVDYFELDNEFILVLKYEEYHHIELKEDLNIIKSASLLADFHHILNSCDNNLMIDKNITSISTRIKERMKQLPNHPKEEEIMFIYNNISKLFTKLDQEFMDYDSLQIIHGDFGERNIVVDSNEEWRLIDFERVRYDNIWMEFLKVFEFELISDEKKEQFLESYLKKRHIKQISDELYIALVFLETLAIYKYSSDVNDYEFSNKADYLIDKIIKTLEMKPIVTN